MKLTHFQLDNKIYILDKWASIRDLEGAEVRLFLL
jgi:hypothetical protein